MRRSINFDLRSNTMLLKQVCRLHDKICGCQQNSPANVLKLTQNVYDFYGPSKNISSINIVSKIHI